MGSKFIGILGISYKEGTPSDTIIKQQDLEWSVSHAGGFVDTFLELSLNSVAVSTRGLV